MTENKHRESFVSGIIKQNPLFISMLGTCPALAVTTSLESAFGMGLLFTFVLLCSNVIISLLKKLIPEVVHTPCYIVVIAAFVTITKMFTEAFLPELFATLGVFLSLLVVNCIVLGRAEAFANKNSVLDSLLDALGNGIGYTLAICIIDSALMTSESVDGSSEPKPSSIKRCENEVFCVESDDKPNASPRLTINVSPPESDAELRLSDT